MPLDPSISLGVKPMQIENPANQLAQIYQLSQAQQANQLNQLKMQEYQQQMTEKNALRGLDPAASDYINQLKRLNPDLGFKAEKEQSEALKRKSDIETARIQGIKQKLAIASQLYSGATPENWSVVRSRLAALNPEAEHELPAQFDPKFIQSEIKQGIDAEKMLPKFESFTVPGVGVQTGTKNALTGEFTPGQVYKEQLSPYQRQQLARKDQEIGLQRQRLEWDKTKPSNADLKIVPAQAQKAILGADSALRKLDDAIALLEQNKDAVGAKGYLPDIALNRMFPEGTEARAAISDIGSLVLHDRSGAAVTAAEYPRQAPFIPKINDDYDTALKKLKRMRELQAEDAQAFTEVYTPEQGFRPFNVPIRPEQKKPSRTSSGKVSQIPTNAPTSGVDMSNPLLKD